MSRSGGSGVTVADPESALGAPLRTVTVRFSEPEGVPSLGLSGDLGWFRNGVGWGTWPQMLSDMDDTVLSL